MSNKKDDSVVVKTVKTVVAVATAVSLSNQEPDITKLAERQNNLQRQTTSQEATRPTPGSGKAKTSTPK